MSRNAEIFAVKALPFHAIPQSVQRVEAAQAISTDIPAIISPHVFRHTKAMHLVQANVNTIYIKDYLGHADISTTEVYARADNEAKRAALEKASLCLELPCTSNWEQDADLIAWLSSLG